MDVPDMNMPVQIGEIVFDICAVYLNVFILVVLYRHAVHIHHKLLLVRFCNLNFFCQKFLQIAFHCSIAAAATSRIPTAIVMAVKKQVEFLAPK